MFAAGAYTVLMTVLRPSVAHSAAEQKVGDYNARVSELLGFVLMIPAGCAFFGYFRNEQEQGQEIS